MEAVQDRDSCNGRLIENHIDDEAVRPSRLQRGNERPAASGRATAPLVEEDSTIAGSDTTDCECSVDWSVESRSDVNSWRSYACPFLTYRMSYDVRHRPTLTMRLEPLRMPRITWPVREGQIVPKYLKSLTPICLSLCNAHGSMIKVNRVICHNSVRPCVKGECDVVACAKSRDLSVGGRKQLHFRNLWPRYAYSLYNFYGTTMTIDGRLHGIMSNVKGVSERKFPSPVEKSPKMAVFAKKLKVRTSDRQLRRPAVSAVINLFFVHACLSVSLG